MFVPAKVCPNFKKAFSFWKRAKQILDNRSQHFLGFRHPKNLFFKILEQRPRNSPCWFEN